VNGLLPAVTITLLPEVAGFTTIFCAAQLTAIKQEHEKAAIITLFIIQYLLTRWLNIQHPHFIQ
jgi:hypothetical protein